MSSFSMRPTFELQLAHPKEELVQRIRVVLTRPPWNANSLIFDDYAELHIPPEEARYWSPHLSLCFEGDEKQTHILGRFAPRQEVWTLVWIIYLVLAFSAFFAAVFAYAHWLLGRSTWIIAIPPIAIAGIGVLYLISYIGQQLSSDHMEALRADWQSVLEQSLVADFPINPNEM